MSEYKQAQAKKARRRQAWELLKQTRNATYVNLQFPEFELAKLEAALEKIPDNSGRPHVRSPAAQAIRSGLRPASEVLPDMSKGEREPGCDDECKHGNDPRRCDCCINGRRSR